ncbi:det1 complexing ubiquitin ligase domain-containing protein [Ditylenchus destructor]|nr:det1 complexing ubiquitin ligase domain-containing protein [Ditylenchus destructor]
MSIIQPANTFLKDLPVSDPENFSKVNKDSKLLRIRPKIIHDVEIGDDEKRIQVDKVPMLLRYLKNHWNINNPTDQKEEIRNGQKRLAPEHPTHRINNETLVDGQIRRSFSNQRISDNDVREMGDEHLQQGPSTSSSSNKRDEASSSTVGARTPVNRTHKRERQTRTLAEEAASDDDSQSRQNLMPSTSVTRARNISDSSSDIPTKSRRRS